MRNSVLRGGAVSLVACLTACGVGGIDVAYDEPYCLVAGKDPQNPEYEECGASSAFLFRDDGTVDRFSPRDLGFVERGTLSSNVLSVGDRELKLEKQQGALRVQTGNPDDEYWVVPASGVEAASLKQLDADLRAFDPDEALPESTDKYVDEPICYTEAHYRNGRLVSDANNCDYGNISVFSSSGRIVSFNLNSLDSDKPPSWSASDTWRRNRDGVGHPVQDVELPWQLSAAGYPDTGRQIVRQERTGMFQRHDPNRREVHLAYEPYTGPKRDEAIEYYQSEIYPVLRRRLVIGKHFPDLVNYRTGR